MKKTVWAIVAAVLFAGGLYVGVQMAKPPPPPDLGLLSSRPAAEPAQSSPSSPEPPPPVTSSESPGETPGDASDAKNDGGSSSEEEPVKILRQPAPGSAGAPKIALVIDDLGRSVRDVEQLAALGIPITYSVLPFEVRTSQVVEALRSRGFEYLCHLPMEAKGDANPGPGALGPSMGREALRTATLRALDAVPGAVGANNHMGSAVMSDRKAATEVLELLAGRGLFFVDSRTSADTLGYSLARGLGIPSAERQVFLDASGDPAAIREQWSRLLEEAKTRGAALAIAHPHDATLAVLKQAVPEARQAGFEFVQVSKLVER